jgi:hypothetical protein
VSDGVRDNSKPLCRAEIVSDTFFELNPVRAAMVEAPQDYRWSSVHTHLARARDPLITPHPLYLAMGNDNSERAHVMTQRFLHRSGR